LTKLISGSFDGEVRSWDIVERKTLFSLNDHKAIIKGVCFAPESGQFMVTSADDKTINLYDHYKLINSTQKSVAQSVDAY
jgi:WD40 repeat protein